MRRLAEFDLAACAYRGRVLDPLEEDRGVEERFFAGWLNWLEIPLHRMRQGFAAGNQAFNVVEDAGRPALEYVAVRPFLLLAGDGTWRDYEVAGEVRCLVNWTFPYATHDEVAYDFQARHGLALRVQDARRHYFCGFQNGRRLVIAARDDANWTILNSVDFAVDPDRAYHVRARCEAERIEVWVDGERRLVVDDDRWDCGPAGLYGNAPCRWWSATVQTQDVEAARIAERGVARRQELAEAASRVPQPRPVRQVRLPLEENAVLTASGPYQQAVSVLPLAEDCLVVAYARQDGSGLLAVTLDGAEVWRRQIGAGRRPIPFTVGDVNADGLPELVALNGEDALLLDGATGKTLASTPYPARCPFLGYRREKASLRHPPKVWRTAGRDRPPRVIFFEDGGWGGRTVWCYDHNLQHRWTHLNTGGRFGHNLAAWDIDHDGRDEILATYYALDDDGRVVWRTRGHDQVFMGEHADNLVVEPLQEGGPARIVATCGLAGVLFLNAADGEILARLSGIGHAQNIFLGNFRHDRPGREIWVLTDWGCPGVAYLFDGEGRILHRSQPDPRVMGTSARTVRWWDDGRDLLLLQGTRETMGLWDGFGRRVVDLTQAEGMPDSVIPTATGIPLREPVSVCRFTGEDTDRLVVADGLRLLVYAPS